MVVVENTFYYPLLQSNPIFDLSELIRILQNPRENAVSAKFIGPQNENETEIQKNGLVSCRYVPIVYESPKIF